MSQELYKMNNYTLNIQYLSEYIREYDISKANISILKSEGLISNNEYNYLYNLDKIDRQVAVGLMSRENPTIKNAILDGITEAKKYLFLSNNIEDTDILSIKNDAVYVINKSLRNTVTDKGIEFKHKSTYTSYYKFNKCEFYYYLDLINKKEHLDVKGIKPDKLLLHDDFFLDFLKEVFYQMQIGNHSKAVEIIQIFYTDLSALRLEMGFYRSFDAFSVYRFKNTDYCSDIEVDSKYIDQIDFNKNLSIIRNLYTIVSKELINFNNKHKLGINRNKKV